MTIKLEFSIGRGDVIEFDNSLVRRVTDRVYKTRHESVFVLDRSKIRVLKENRVIVDITALDSEQHSYYGNY
ncbi:hypothetical protein K435DRAFT_274010 [Dendrothele bispora CBS 962.96]|uniref:Uncharacterized protein n=1 Tax=Dendrothele bispora (strain CBS 962.96) TaxID=1314807 RepID=A0A4S8LLY6_DENBC|nr:hypothetical protein K435DRAFT_274010 [Dendrothele bispora CBS 962.96]